MNAPWSQDDAVNLRNWLSKGLGSRFLAKLRESNPTVPETTDVNAMAGLGWAALEHRRILDVIASLATAGESKLVEPQLKHVEVDED